ncbi:amino acid transporter protein [Klebsormidium nitens]|uniref:Amino acid transporter protein n=1 Tax=Klebsormidium nitens TaxID=105231 RepID=A0A1Y1HLJ9_KLENI|nr:amino acid transporter protein [Klebsormidium nitens]|eukprot:GAQ79495.1 amino acid transporter protein [Klebsormidium nitens]
MVPAPNADDSLDPLLLTEGGKAPLAHIPPRLSQQETRNAEVDIISNAEDPLLGKAQSSSLGFTKLDLLEAIDGRALAGAGTANQLQTIFNIINLYMGIGVFVIGHAFALGGWATLLFLFLFSAVFCFSAQLLCASFEKLPGETAPSYPALGFLAGGAVGQWGVFLVSVTEFFGDTCILLLSIWQSLIVLFPPSGGVCLGLVCLDPRQSVILATLVALLPAIWLRGFSKLTVIAVSGVVSSLVLTAVMVGTVVIDPTSAHVSGEGSHQHTFLRAPSLPTGIGVMLVSLSGHQSLPSLKRSMRRPQHFGRCLYVAFGSMFLLYAVMGSLSYQYFGESCDVLVTHNLIKSSAISKWVILRFGAFRVRLAQVLSALLALSAFSTTPPVVLVLGDLLIDMTQGGAQGHVSSLSMFRLARYSKQQPRLSPH